MKPDSKVIHRITLSTLADEGVSSEILKRPASDIKLTGKGRVLKSIGLVALLIGIEERLRVECGLQVLLLDQDSLAQADQPLRDVATLEQYIMQCVDRSVCTR